MPGTISQAEIGYQTIFARGDGGSPVEIFTELAEIYDIKFAGPKASKIEVTHMSSPNAYKEFLIGLLDPGELTLELRYLASDAGHKAMIADLQNRAKRNFKVTFPPPGSQIFTFAGYVMEWPINVPVEAPIVVVAKVQITGVITFPA